MFDIFIGHIYVCSIQRQLFYCVLYNADSCVFHVFSSHWVHLLQDLIKLNATLYVYANSFKPINI